MVVHIKGADTENIAAHRLHSEVIAEEAQKHGVNCYTTKPLSFENTATKIGNEPALLMLSMLSDVKCSKEGIATVIDVMRGIAGDEPISVAELDFKPPFVRPLNFKLQTPGFLKEDFNNSKHMTCSFKFTPEAKYNRSIMREGARGVLSLDLEIEMHIVVFMRKTETTPRVFESVNVSTVVVEFDGPDHLRDEMVRTDKERDSMIQAMGKTVFRIQTPYKQRGMDSTKKYNTELNDLVKRHIGDIKEHFRQMMFHQFEVSDLINTARNADKQAQF